MDEEEVIRDILAGNINRYAEIVKSYQTIVANLCFKMGGLKLDIEEMTQQVFVELYQALPRFQFKSKLSTFIYRITVNVVCKELKHQKRFIVPTDDNPLPDRAGQFSSRAGIFPINCRTTDRMAFPRKDPHMTGGLWMSPGVPRLENYLISTKPSAIARRSADTVPSSSWRERSTVCP